MKGIDALREATKIQKSPGNWNCNAYMLGMANGMEFALATMEDRDPEYLTAPEKWLDDIKLDAEPVSEPSAR